MAKLVTGLVTLCIAQTAFSLPTIESEPVFTPLGVGTTGESQAGIASVDDGLVPEFVTLDAEILRSVVESNITEVPPLAFGDAAQAERRGIVGPVDDRVLWTDRNYPYSAIGRIQFGGIWCSATLVGPRHVATALHCIPEQGVPITFQPAYAGGDTYPSSAVQYVLNPGVPWGAAPCWEFNDWAILVLRDRIGEQRGYFGANVVEDQHLNKNTWYHMGYPEDHDRGTQPYRQGQITVARLGEFSDCPNERRAMMVTDADVIPGQSGGPLWLGPEWDANGGRYVYGVCSGSNGFESTFSGGSVFMQWIGAARINYP